MARAVVAVLGLAIERRIGRLQCRAFDERLLADRWREPRPGIGIAVRADSAARFPIQHASATLTRWPRRSRDVQICRSA
jgi:hypothetical protein